MSCLRSGAALLCLPWRGGDTAELLGNVLEELWDVQEQLRAPGGQAGDGVSLEPPQILLKVGESHGIDGV